MAATSNDIKNGLCMKFNNGIYSVVEFLHVKPGKGPAFVRTKLKNLTNGRVIDNTFSAGHKIEVVRVERRKYQYLYKEGDAYHFMNQETYEQTFIDEALINAPQFLKEGDFAEIVFDADEEKALLCELPASLVLQVTYTEPGEKGNTATNAFKLATVETGAEVRVPLFINIGDHIKISTVDGAYSERVKV
ncbi:MAG: elongation factor P [Bacteroidetes bacterium HGW-Bacteroidetes-12]|nr:MAG: elongation factor P [Bacteroidetes bacterium HGW-Bacteroidetes-12]